MENTYGIYDLVGEVIKTIKLSDDDTELIFITEDGKEFRMYHIQDCCEGVWLDDINGDMNDLIGSLIIEAYEHTEDCSDGFGDGDNDSCTATFYDLRTIKGSVHLTWRGVSNGYYSEEVSFERTI